MKGEGALASNEISNGSCFFQLSSFGNHYLPMESEDGTSYQPSYTKWSYMTAVTRLGLLQIMNMTSYLHKRLLRSAMEQLRRRRMSLCARLQTLCCASNAVKPESICSQMDCVITPILLLLTRKHPSWKIATTAPSDKELHVAKKGINCNVFMWDIRALKVDVAPGLGCHCNKHLLALAINTSRQMTPSTAAAIENYLDYEKGSC